MKIMSLIRDLPNPLLAKKKALDLHIIKTKRPQNFHRSDFFHKVMKLLGQYPLRLPVIRFVIDLFDRRVLRRIVLDESDDESEEEEDVEIEAEDEGDVDDNDQDAETPFAGE